MTHSRLLGFVLLILAATPAAQGEIRPDFLMDTNTDCTPFPPVKRLDLPKNVSLWIEALGRPEIDMQRMASDSISTAALEGVHDLPKAIPALEKILVSESSHPAARFAAARALIQIDSRNSADKLFDASRKHGADMRQLIEPKLAQWNFGPIKAVWTGRLDTPSKWPRDLFLAIRGISQVQETTAAPQLKAIVFDLILTPDIRLEAASALGQLVRAGLEEDADRLIHEKRTSPIVNRHCALRLLANHDSEQTRRLLAEIASDADPSLVGGALQKFYDIDPNLVLPFAEEAIKNLDANVRTVAARTYVSLPTTDRIPPLARLLDDPHPGVRRQVCQDLKTLAAKPELNETIRSSAMEMLHQESWRGQEQASLLLGDLEHQPASKRMVELLESPRTEVDIASAWGLRRIADSGTVPGIMDKIRRQTTYRLSKGNPDWLDLQVAHLFEALGQIRAKEAESLMKEYIPKSLPMGERSRSAAIWALGWLHEGIPDDQLAIDLNDRINDWNVPPAEMDGVRLHSIISIGRMKAVKYATEFRVPIEKKTHNDRLSLARRWAIKQMTGEELPNSVPDIINIRGWFLEPIFVPDAE
jgi:HEAT repeat protein